MPVNKVVHIHLRSQDVIHSFFIPPFRIKQDAVPGREIVQWIEVTKPGKYELPCAELCGFGHSGMKGCIFVHTPEEYRSGLETAKSAAAPRPAPAGLRSLAEGGKEQAMAQSATAAAHDGHEHHELGFVRKYIFSDRPQDDRHPVPVPRPVHAGASAASWRCWSAGSWRGPRRRCPGSRWLLERDRAA